MNGTTPILITKLYFPAVSVHVLNDLIAEKPFSSWRLKCILKSLPLCIFCLQTCIAYNTVAQPHLTRGLGTLTYVKHAFPNLKRKGLQNKNCINIWHGTKRGYPENGKPDSTGGHWAGTLSCTRGRTGSSTRGVSCVSLGPGSPIKSRCSARL